MFASNVTSSVLFVICIRNIFLYLIYLHIGIYDVSKFIIEPELTSYLKSMDHQGYFPVTHTALYIALIDKMLSIFYQFGMIKQIDITETAAGGVSEYTVIIACETYKKIIMDAMNKGAKGWENTLLDGDLKAPAQISDSESDYEYNTSKAGTPIENLETQPILYNARALDRNDETYKLETFEKNYLMIFNQVNLDGYSSPRFGTQKDVEALKKTFLPIGFEIHEHTDLTKDQIMEELKVLKEKDFTEYGCVAVAVLTHGTHGGLLRAKDMQYSETEIIKHFKILKNPSLVTKPKILIIQACRGTKSIRGVEAQGPISIHKDIDEEDESYTLPLESDILVLHSSYAGNPSHRVNLHGSWFIQILCEEIMKKSPAIDLEAIITDVKRKVAIDMCHEVYNKRTGRTDINKQMPVIMSTLIRKLYLKPFEDVTCVDNDVVENDAAVEESVPITPLLVRFGPCSCFLDHFTYLKKCLRYILNEHPEDRIAQNYLELCDTFDDGDQFNSAKEKMAKLISEHLRCTAQDFEFYKYLYIYQSRIEN